jgi:parallel beta-helix repeat protein
VSDWKRDATAQRWLTSTTPAGSNFEFKPLRYIDKNYIDPKWPMAGHREMVYVNGRALAQVETAAQVTASTFWIDYDKHQLHIGIHPAGKTIEVVAHEEGLRFSRGAAGSRMKGIDFSHYSNHAVVVASDDVQIQDCNFTHNSMTGFNIYGEAAGVKDIVLRNCKFDFNGNRGAGADNVANLLVEDCSFASNNVEHFMTNWDAAAIKCIELRDSTFRRNVFADNLSAGLWLDVNCLRNKIHHNIARNNQGPGLFYEISHDAIIAFNICVNNKEGITVSGSSKVRIYNNTLIRNGWNLVVADAGRHNDPLTDGGRCGGGGTLDGDSHECGERAEAAAQGADWTSHSNVVRNNILWNNNQMRAEHPGLLAAGGNYNYVDGKAVNEPSSLMFSELDYNAYFRSNSQSPARTVKWYTDKFVDYPTLDDFRGAHPSYEKHGIFVENTPDPFFVDAERGDYRLKPGSPALKRGAALPEDIAALSEKSGSDVHLGALAFSLPVHDMRSQGRAGKLTSMPARVLVGQAPP